MKVRTNQLCDNYIGSKEPWTRHLFTWSAITRNVNSPQGVSARHVSSSVDAFSGLAKGEQDKKIDVAGIPVRVADINNCHCMGDRLFRKKKFTLRSSVSFLIIAPKHSRN